MFAIRKTPVVDLDDLILSLKKVGISYEIVNDKLVLWNSDFDFTDKPNPTTIAIDIKVRTTNINV